MLTKVEVRNQKGGLLTLPFEDIPDGLLVTEITGLDPVKAEIASSNFATVDGEFYQSSRRGVRNIVMTIALEPDYTDESVLDLRNRVYAYFMTKTQVFLKFFRVDDLVTEVAGRVESCDVAIFTEEPSATISILCFDPDFVEDDPVVIDGETVDVNTITNVDYEGTTETGFLLTVNIDQPMDSLTIYHKTPTDELRTLEFSMSLLAGDVVRISTAAGEKGATLTRLGVVTSVLYAIPTQSTWMNLIPGTNGFWVYAEESGVPYQLEFFNRYGGL
jgi:tail protein